MGASTADITKSGRKEPGHIEGTLGSTLVRREGAKEANNGTHSHSASAYKFLVALLFSKCMWSTVQKNNSNLVFKLLKSSSLTPSKGIKLFDS